MEVICPRISSDILHMRNAQIFLLAIDWKLYIIAFRFEKQATGNRIL